MIPETGGETHEQAAGKGEDAERGHEMRCENRGKEAQGADSDDRGEDQRDFQHGTILPGLERTVEACQIAWSP